MGFGIAIATATISQSAMHDCSRIVANSTVDEEFEGHYQGVKGGVGAALQRVKTGTV